ncbi:hypothetical protein QWY14_02960 [Planococcus sp. N028]|uniref:Menaquinol-cytochrome c reductase cytochrome b subunit n=1 Tax=Planococcus shixiaomingii TaxID=3058393 RepID=A0ABT8MYM5_9BACL|nr:hypothetical protein [Planococcus sp. N028]MDN7240729.1 hypothetical protein [Planococcus sp. N028]
MKLFLQAMASAAAIHVVYYVTTLAVGYVKTVTHRPNMAEAWKNVEGLEQEVVISAAVSPLSYVGSFLVLTLVCALVIYVYQKVDNGESFKKL